MVETMHPPGQTVNRGNVEGLKGEASSQFKTQIQDYKEIRVGYENRH
jgi:hypothetical protein